MNDVLSPQNMIPHTCLSCGQTFWSLLLISPAFADHVEHCHALDDLLYDPAMIDPSPEELS